MKKKISVKYFFNFKEDKRKSMEMISNYLYQNQKKNKNFNVSKFIPSFSTTYSNILKVSWNLRYNRYIHYPKLAKKLKKFDVAHIIDHQYAHLVKHLPCQKKIITVHDLIPEKFKEQLGKTPHLVRYSLSHLKYFDKVIAVSNNTRNDILKYTDCPSKKIVVLQTTVDEKFNLTQINKKKICDQYKIPYKSRKILIVGTNFYKNHETSLKILEKIKKVYKKDVLLLKIGHKLKIPINNQIKKNILEIKNLPRSEINKIYKISDLLLFPSVYEGYGLPLLEAMKSGIPIVASNIKTTKEILGTYSELFHPFEINSYVKSILKIFENKNFTYNLKKKLKKTSYNFNQKEYFVKISKLYEEN